MTNKKTLRVFVTPKDIREAGCWDGGGKDPVTRATTRAARKAGLIGPTQQVIAGGTLLVFPLPNAINRQVVDMPPRLQRASSLAHNTPEQFYHGPRFNFRLTF